MKPAETMWHAILAIMMHLCLAVGSSPVSAAEPPPRQPVEILLEAEHTLEGLKSGDKVDLKIVTGKTKIGKRTIYMTQAMADGLEVGRFAVLEKPDEHGRSIRVELMTTAAQAKTLEKAKNQVVTAVETAPGEGAAAVRRPVRFRIERTKP